MEQNSRVLCSLYTEHFCLDICWRNCYRENNQFLFVGGAVLQSISFRQTSDVPPPLHPKDQLTVNFISVKEISGQRPGVGGRSVGFLADLSRQARM